MIRRHANEKPVVQLSNVQVTGFIQANECVPKGTNTVWKLNVKKFVNSEYSGHAV
jgi:hypothetical protein